MPDDDTASTWSVAFTRARDPGWDDVITVPKAAEPELPETLAVRQSPLPFSLPRGAETVYRQDEPGEHYQIREYDDRWTVDYDRYNPHYAPLKHFAADAGPSSLVAAGVGLVSGRGVRG